MFFLLQHKEIFIYEEKSLKRIIILVLFYLKKKNPDDLENSSKRSGNGYKEGRKSVLSRRLWSF